MLDPCVTINAQKHAIQGKIVTKGSSGKDNASVCVCALGCIIFGSKINSPMMTATSLQGKEKESMETIGHN